MALKSTANAQSKGSGVVTLKALLTTGVYSTKSWRMNDEPTAYQRDLFLKTPTFHTGYLSDRAEIALANSIRIMEVSSCVRASSRGSYITLPVPSNVGGNHG